MYALKIIFVQKETRNYNLDNINWIIMFLVFDQNILNFFRYLTNRILIYNKHYLKFLYLKKKIT